MKLLSQVDELHYKEKEVDVHLGAGFITAINQFENFTIYEMVNFFDSSNPGSMYYFLIQILQSFISDYTGKQINFSHKIYY